MPAPRNSTTGSNGRHYTWRDERFPSVTTIISRGVPKPALPNWAARKVAETAVEQHHIWQPMARHDQIDWLKRSPWRDTQAAQITGSTIHDWAEKRALGIPVTTSDLDPEHRPYAESWLSFVHMCEPTWEMAEASVYSREHNYAGTLDALLRLSDRAVEKIAEAGGPDMSGLILVDYKTSRSGIYPEVALQLAAYRHAEFVGLPDGTEHPMPAADRCAALWIRPDGWDLIPVDAHHIAFEAFLAARQIADFSDGLGKRLLGRPVAFPEPADRPTPTVDPSVFV